MFKWIKDNILWEALCFFATNAIGGGAMIALPPVVLGFLAKLDGFPPSMIALFVLCGGVYAFWLHNELQVLYQRLQGESFAISFIQDARFLTYCDHEMTCHFLLENSRNDLMAIRDCHVSIASILPTPYQVPDVDGPPPSTDTIVMLLPQTVKWGFDLNAGQSIRVPFISYSNEGFVSDLVTIRGANECFYAREKVPYTLTVLVTGAEVKPLSKDFIVILNDGQLSVRCKADISEDFS